jgi:hypothetical protein
MQGSGSSRSYDGSTKLAALLFVMTGVLFIAVYISRSPKSAYGLIMGIGYLLFAPYFWVRTLAHELETRQRGQLIIGATKIMGYSGLGCFVAGVAMQMGWL